VTDQKKKKEQDKKKNCVHEWKGVGYGFGVLRCQKCGAHSDDY
jgi:hypothetical protein